MSKIQYTIRGTPEPVDRVIKKRAKQTGKSFNKTVVDILSLQTFGTTDLKDDDNFDFLVGADTLDEAFDEAIRDLSEVDKKMWQ